LDQAARPSEYTRRSLKVYRRLPVVHVERFAMPLVQKVAGFPGFLRAKK
jgi:hypothetical protein